MGPFHIDIVYWKGFWYEVTNFVISKEELYFQTLPDVVRIDKFVDRNRND